MLNFFEFDGKDSRDFGIIVKNKTVYSQPQKSNTFLSIPGRSGDLITSENKLQNKKIEYELLMFIDEDAARLHSDKNLLMRYAINDVKDWLQTSSDYKILTDSYIGSEYYIYANMSGGINFKDINAKVASFTVTFNCKPYEYLFSGQEKLTFTYSGNPIYIINPELANSLPIFKIYGSNQVVFAVASPGYQKTITLNINSNEYFEFDCETQNCYKGTTNMNRYFIGDYPMFKKGINTLNVHSGTISQIDVIPRWRKE